MTTTTTTPAAALAEAHLKEAARDLIALQQQIREGGVYLPQVCAALAVLKGDCDEGAWVNYQNVVYEVAAEEDLIR